VTQSRPWTEPHVFDVDVAGGVLLNCNQKTAQLLEYEIGSGQDVELQSFASEVLPVVLQHLRTAQDIQADMTAEAP
jgi:putative membrane protein